ncbi:hypothetical protein CTEN210_16789 [Chaetoceros tenuissimus]|uniref:RING-type domain-containing protein n=1 Tax=Chaetoceros tenuissimus TaxID=426638 RepID=A0AAD3D9M7_9STRA|nr:hypothetical protein CTEN210_16789 [Chaetoceros tenuissimus]
MIGSATAAYCSSVGAYFIEGRRTSQEPSRIRFSRIESMSGQSIASNRPGGPRQPMDTIKCHLCRKTVERNVFVLKCDHLLCQACTYSHFEKHSNCPLCTAIMQNDDDIEEVNILDRAPNEAVPRRATLQALFTRPPGRANAVGISQGDLLMNSMRTIDSCKQQIKLAYRQLVTNNNVLLRQNAGMAKELQRLRNENAALGETTQRLRNENSSLKEVEMREKQENKILRSENSALIARNQELERLQSHSSSKSNENISRSQYSSRDHGTAMNRLALTTYSGSQRDHRDSNPLFQHPKPPLVEGLLRKREAQQQADRQQYNPPPRGPILGNRVSSSTTVASSITGIGGRQDSNRGGHRGSTYAAQGPRIPTAHGGSRVGGSMSSETPRYSSGQYPVSRGPPLRDLSPNGPLPFSGGLSTSSSAGGSSGRHRVNKRRRAAPSQTPAESQGMSPGTSRFLNQGGW